MLYAERFELCEHIASCKTGGSVSVSYTDGNSCTYTDSNVTLFYAGNNNCNKGGWDTDIFPTLDEYLAVEIAYACILRIVLLKPRVLFQTLELMRVFHCVRRLGQEEPTL